MFSVQRIRIRQQRIQLEETMDGQLRMDEIQKLKKSLDTQQQMFNKQGTQHHSIVKASFVVSESNLVKENLSKNVWLKLQV
jgi:uncharacterized membrane protein YcaP (DUF421 family)